MRVLVVEDDLRIVKLVSGALSANGYTVDVASDGEQAPFLVQTEPYDAVVLDIGLPKLDGLSILRDMRRQGRDVPVLLLTARSGWRDRVEGLDAGADDYLPKPFQMEELVARVRALIRRSSGKAAPLLIAGPVALDTRQARVYVNDQLVELTAHEFKLLSYFMHHPDTVISRTELSEHIYGYEGDRDSNTIDVFVARLRAKIGAGLIMTVRGLGFRLDTAP